MNSEERDEVEALLKAVGVEATPLAIRGQGFQMIDPKYIKAHTSRDIARLYGDGYLCSPFPFRWFCLVCDKPFLSPGGYICSWRYCGSCVDIVTESHNLLCKQGCCPVVQ